MDGEIVIEMNEEGALRTDIAGLMYMLKSKRIPKDSFVIAVIGDSIEEGQYVESYMVTETEGNSHALVLFEEYEISDDQFEDKDFDEFMELPLHTKEEMLEELGFSIKYSDDEPDTFYIELDELMMDCTYFVYPNGQMDTKKKSEHYTIIHYEEALHRMQNGETVCVDYGKEAIFKDIDSSAKLTTDIILEGIWATTPRLKDKKDKKKVKENLSPIKDTSDTLSERLDTFLKQETKKKHPTKEDKKKDNDALHDLGIDLFLEELKLFLQRRNK